MTDTATTPPTEQQPQQPATPTPPRGITRIGVKGFKSIVDESIEIRPLTVLAGANSSGKSSIMQPLLLVKQTLESVMDYKVLKIDGPNAVFTEAEQFLVKSGNGYRNFSITLNSEDGYFRVTFSRKRKRLLKVVSNSHFSLSWAMDTMLRPSLSAEKIYELMPSIVKEMFQDIKELKFSLKERAFFVVPTLVNDDHGIRLAYSGLLDTIFTSDASELILNCIHVPANRGNPERSYHVVSAESSTFRGRFEDYTASVIKYWQDINSTMLKRLESQLQTLNLANKVNINIISQTEAEIQVGLLSISSRNSLISIADVGFGVSQVLPVLVALLVAQPGQLVYIEQPELHLHPRAQHKLAEFIAEAATRGVRVVIETHSDLLLLGIQTEIAKKKISNQDVIFHWFSRNDEGLTEIQSVVPDEDGAYGGWPEDFAEVIMDAQNQYLDAVDDNPLESEDNPVEEAHGD
jgi:predicted ATPase